MDAARTPVLALVLALVLVLTATAATAQSTLDVVREYRAAHGPAILAEYRSLLALPNVASDSIGIWRNASYLRDRLDELGFTAELLTVAGAPPVVFGELRVPGAPRTLALYVHYDGQPVDPARWTHGPWEPTLYTRSMEAGGEPRPFPDAGEPIDPEWRIYARSAGDDKAPFGALFPVLDALREAGIAPTSNLLVFFEARKRRGRPGWGNTWTGTGTASMRRTSGSSWTGPSIPRAAPSSPSACGA